jgi:hypothetical protein
MCHDDRAGAGGDGACRAARHPAKGIPGQVKQLLLSAPTYRNGHPDGKTFGRGREKRFHGRKKLCHAPTELIENGKSAVNLDRKSEGFGGNLDKMSTMDALTKDFFLSYPLRRP